jgi:hypothetical protein
MYLYPTIRLQIPAIRVQDETAGRAVSMVPAHFIALGREDSTIAAAGGLEIREKIVNYCGREGLEGLRIERINGVF